jgi:hypothetical protein
MEILDLKSVGIYVLKKNIMNFGKTLFKPLGHK